LNGKGHVRTPNIIVEHMVAKLFEKKPPMPSDRVLDAGCGQGEFIEAIISYCRKNDYPVPRIFGFELDKELASISRKKFLNVPDVIIEERDFLTISSDLLFQYIISNPPYVSITKISEEEKELYKKLFTTAIGRFDFYLLFFEKAIELLAENGRLVFISPEKFMYVQTAEPLRRKIAEMQVKEIEFLNEDTFSGLVTYPTITIIEKSAIPVATVVTPRDGPRKSVLLTKLEGRWLPILNGNLKTAFTHTLEDICLRISCGVATGADEIFVKATDSLESGLKEFAYPTISGRELTNQKTILKSSCSLLVPYDENSNLIPFEELGTLKDYLSKPEVMERLKNRTCCKKKKPWYSFHENPPMNDILRSKILCKDLAPKPNFWLDKEGCIIPRHSVYYIIPKNQIKIEEMLDYLKSDFANEWLIQNCQRASNNFIRLQSHILKKLPIPERLYSS